MLFPTRWFIDNVTSLFLFRTLTLSVGNGLDPVRQGYVLRRDIYGRIRLYQGEGWFREKWAAGDSREDVPSAGVEEWTGIELSPSAACLGEMQGILIPAVNVAFASRAGCAQFAGLPSLHP